MQKKLEIPKDTGIKNYSTIKAFDIIEYMAEQNNEPCRLYDLANNLSMNTSTVSRFLTSLKNCGYVQQDPLSLRYSLTLKICAIANKVSSNIRLFDIALPIMKEISVAVQESVCLAIEQDDSVVYIGTVPGSDKILNTMQRIGNRAPMHCTGVGKVLLLNRTKNEIHRFVKDKGMAVYTQNTISTEEQLLKELEMVKANGYAFDNEECEMGARCISFPVMDYTGKIIAGISITGTVFRLSKEKIYQWLPYFSEKAKQLSGLLGYE